MTERVKGLTLEEAAAIRNTEVAKELSLPPVKCKFPTPLPDTFLVLKFDIIGAWISSHIRCWVSADGSALFDVGGGCS